MSAHAATDPGRFIADFLTSFTNELLASDEDAAAIVDRYHTTDVLQVADGFRIDRAKLIEHVGPVRRTRPELRVEVHDALRDGDRIAARYTLHTRTRKRDLSIEVYFFGQFTLDGRMRRAHMLTRHASADAEATRKEG